MARGDRDLGKERFWRGVLRRFRGSELTVREFCAEHGVSEASFYAWRRTIARRDQQSKAEVSEQRPVFVPLTVVPTSPSSVLEVLAISGRVVRVPPDFDACVLRRLLAVLDEGAASC
jgi:transposase-like protein